MAKSFGYHSAVAKVGIGALRDQVSQYARRAERGETIVILNRDREVAVLKPFHARVARSTRFLGSMKGTATIHGDIVKPVIPEHDWFRS